jgi:NitT/TauT family transport system substrate-binding protein
MIRTMSVIRQGFRLALGLALFASAASAQARDTPIRFQLDWRFEGPAALFTLPNARGWFRDEGLAVSIDAGDGSGGTIARVARGDYDMGFADLASLMAFWGTNPDLPGKPVAVMMVYNNTPSAVMALKKSGIKRPSDLAGKTLGAPAFDAGRKTFPIFAKSNGIDPARVKWVSMAPGARESMLARGEVDAITGFYFTSLFDLNASGVKDEDIVVMPYSKFGVTLYGSAIIVSEAFLRQHPDQVKAFLRAFTRGVKAVVADPQAAVATLRDYDAGIDLARETKRLKLTLNGSVLSADARAEGFGEVDPARLTLMALQVKDAFGLTVRIPAERIFGTGLLPPASERKVFPK